MARINIEDDIESRQEFWRLFEVVKDRDKCLGMLVRFFRLAQKHFSKGDAIAFDELEAQGLTCMIDAGWAVANSSDRYQALGAEKQFAWLAQKKAAGRLGGIQSGIKRHEAGASKDEAAASGANPLTLALSPALTQKKEEISKTPPKPRFDFESLYQGYPLKVGKTDGLTECSKQIRTPEAYEDLRKAIANYAAYHTRPLEPGEFRPLPKHFSTFMRKGRWRECLDPEFGAAVIEASASADPRTRKVMGIEEQMALGLIK